MVEEYKTDINGADILKTRQLKVSIPKDVISIKEQGFKDYHRLRKVYIPKEVQVIGQEAFKNCEKLYEVSLAKNSKISKIPKECFSECQNLQKIRIPDNVVTIEERAFNNCLNIKELEIPDSVKYVAETAFSGWKSDQTLTVYQNYVLVNCEARIGLIKEEKIVLNERITDTNAAGLYFYKVRAKCGHVGKNNFIEVDFPQTAINKRQAAELVRWKSRVKHHAKDAIISVTRINKQEYIDLKENNPSQDYLSCNNPQEQRAIDLNNKIKKEKPKERYRKRKSTKPQVDMQKSIKEIIAESKTDSNE